MADINFLAKTLFRGLIENMLISDTGDDKIKKRCCGQDSNLESILLFSQ